MRVLNALFRQGLLTRSELARQLGLNRSSMADADIVDDLLDEGLVRERDGGPARSGTKAWQARHFG